MNKKKVNESLGVISHALEDSGFRDWLEKNSSDLGLYYDEYATLFFDNNEEPESFEIWALSRYVIKGD